MGQMAFASLFQTDCAREYHSKCNGKATEFVNNGSNINCKFTAIKNTLTTREALSSQDNTRCCCSTTGIQPGVNKPVWCSSQMCHKHIYPGKSNDGMEPQDISCETVHRLIVEGGIVCDLKVAEWMASSSWDR